MILGWSPFKIVSVSAVLYPRWPPWLKIEISSNGQNCFILSQKVPTFELYKHNDELFNKYYGIFYELWTFTYFDRLRKLEKRGDEIKKKKKFSSETIEPFSTKLCWDDSWVVLFQNCIWHFRPPTKMATTAELNLTNGRTIWEIPIKIFSSETTGPIATKLLWNDPWMAPFQIVSGDPDFQPRWPPS